MIIIFDDKIPVKCKHLGIMKSVSTASRSKFLKKSDVSIVKKFKYQLALLLVIGNESSITPMMLIPQIVFSTTCFFTFPVLSPIFPSNYSRKCHFADSYTTLNPGIC